MSDKSLYFVAILPDQLFRDKVKSIKSRISKKYGTKAALRSPAHITLHMPFRWRPDKEEKLFRALEDCATTQVKFEVDLKDYGSFPPRVIYLNVIETDELRDLWKMIVGAFAKKLNLENGTYKNRGFKPHLTVAFRDLRPAEFRNAWEEYRSVSIDHSFELNSIALLKHNGSTWDIYREFEFGNHS